jgi:hypothetical protein
MGQSAGEIAVALGIAEKSPPDVGRVGYVPIIGAQREADIAVLAAVNILDAEVHLAFHADLAAQIAGRTHADARKAVLAGAGAIGSHLAEDLAREGRFTWTIIDDDRLLPHNAARHIAGNAQVPQSKADFLAAHLNAVMAGATARSIPQNLFADGAAGEQVKAAIDEADLIIDATASIVAARHLSDHRAPGRRACVFFNPVGEAAVLLAEPKNRSLTLRDLEAQYFGLVLRTPVLHDHLGKTPETVAYTGACRAITNRIPASRAAVLSGLAAMGLSSVMDGEAGEIAIWSLAPDGTVRPDSAPLEPVLSFEAEGWRISVDDGLVRRVAEMRKQKLPNETGGVLFGLVDIPAKQIHLVAASPAPSDSKGSPGGFVRGVQGVEDMMEDVRRRSGGQVRYVGEWHSHPPRSSARPSTVDREQIDWLAALLHMDSMPALMLIAAEREVSLIFADRRATPLPRRRAA